MRNKKFVEHFLKQVNTRAPFTELPPVMSPERYMIDSNGFIIERADYWKVLTPARARVFKGIKGVPSFKRARALGQAR